MPKSPSIVPGIEQKHEDKRPKDGFTAVEAARANLSYDPPSTARPWRKIAGSGNSPIFGVGRCLACPSFGPLKRRDVDTNCQTRSGTRDGLFEVQFSDGRPSVYFYWDDVASRRLSANQMHSNRALEAAKTLARSERDK